MELNHNTLPNELRARSGNSPNLHLQNSQAAGNRINANLLPAILPGIEEERQVAASCTRRYRAATRRAMPAASLRARRRMARRRRVRCRARWWR